MERLPTLNGSTSKLAIDLLFYGTESVLRALWLGVHAEFERFSGLRISIRWMAWQCENHHSVLSVFGFVSVFWISFREVLFRDCLNLFLLFS